MFIPSLLFSLLLCALPCIGAPAKVALANLPCNFTLAAVNLTLPNANSTGAPLVLGQAGATDGMTFEVSSTYYSYPYNDFPTLELVNNSLRAFERTGTVSITNATSVTSGGTLNWETSTYYSSPAAQNYAAVWNSGDEFAVLAAYEITDLWSLCPFSGFRGQTNVVFNVSADVPPPPYLGFDPADCYPVMLNIIPAEENTSCVGQYSG